MPQVGAPMKNNNIIVQNPQKLLFIHHAAGWGGSPNSMIQIINNLDNKLFQIEVLLLKNSIVAEKLNENRIKYKIASSAFYTKYYHYFLHSEAGYLRFYMLYRILWFSLLWFLSRFYFASKELERLDYDIIHLNSSSLTDWLAPAKKKGKVIIHIREPFRKGKFDLFHAFFRHQIKLYADKIIAISSDNANRINIPEKTSIIYNFASIPEESSPESSYYSKKFLYMGGAAYIKGFYVLVEALDYLDSEVQVLFVGQYDQTIRRRSLKNIVSQLLGVRTKRQVAIEKIKNHKNAIEIGLLPNVDAYLKVCCCLISPFVITHFSRPIIEAFLYKKPVIASDIEGIEEIVTHNVNGFLSKVKDPVSLASLMNYLAKNPLKSKQMGENGYKMALTKFTDFNINAFNDIYCSLK